MPTRPLKKWTPDVVRQRIQVSQIVRRLIKHTMGEIEMSQTQIRAAEILLKKAMPDLSAVEYTNTRSERPVEEWTDAEIYAELSRIRQRRADGDAAQHGGEPEAGPPSPDEIH